MLLEWLTGILGAAAVVGALTGLYRVLEYLGIKETSQLANLVEDNIERAISNYENLLTDYIESKGEDIAKENELLKKILEWLNKNAPKIIKQYFGTNQEQIEEFVRSYVRSLLSKELDQILG